MMQLRIETKPRGSATKVVLYGITNSPMPQHGYHDNSMGSLYHPIQLFKVDSRTIRGLERLNVLCCLAAALADSNTPHKHKKCFEKITRGMSPQWLITCSLSVTVSMSLRWQGDKDRSRQLLEVDMARLLKALHQAF